MMKTCLVNSESRYATNISSISQGATFGREFNASRAANSVLAPSNSDDLCPMISKHALTKAIADTIRTFSPKVNSTTNEYTLIQSLGIPLSTTHRFINRLPLPTHEASVLTLDLFKHLPHLDYGNRRLQ